MNMAPEQRRWGDAERHYVKALRLVPSNGNPHNQLAVIATYGRDALSAAYFYCRAILVETPFPTAEGNLKVMFAKNEQELSRWGPHTIEAFWARFLQFHGLAFAEAHLEDVPDLSNAVLDAFRGLLGTAALAPDAIFRMTAIGIFSAHRLGLRGAKAAAAAAELDGASLASQRSIFASLVSVFNFTFMSELVRAILLVQDRLMGGGTLPNAHILPALVIFCDWLRSTPSAVNHAALKDQRAPTGLSGQVFAARCFFFEAFASFLNASLDYEPVVESADGTAAVSPISNLPEHGHMQGYTPIMPYLATLVVSAAVNEDMEDVSHTPERLARLREFAQSLCSSAHTEGSAWLSYDAATGLYSAARSSVRPRRGDGGTPVGTAGGASAGRYDEGSASAAAATEAVLLDDDELVVFRGRATVDPSVAATHYFDDRMGATGNLVASPGGSMANGDRGGVYSNYGGGDYPGGMGGAGDLDFNGHWGGAGGFAGNPSMGGHNMGRVAGGGNGGPIGGGFADGGAVAGGGGGGGLSFFSGGGHLGGNNGGDLAGLGGGVGGGGGGFYDGYAVGPMAYGGPMHGIGAQHPFAPAFDPLASVSYGGRPAPVFNNGGGGGGGGVGAGASDSRFLSNQNAYPVVNGTYNLYPFAGGEGRGGSGVGTGAAWSSVDVAGIGGNYNNNHAVSNNGGNANGNLYSPFGGGAEGGSAEPAQQARALYGGGGAMGGDLWGPDAGAGAGEFVPNAYDGGHHGGAWNNAAGAIDGAPADGYPGSNTHDNNNNNKGGRAEPSRAF